MSEMKILKYFEIFIKWWLVLFGENHDEVIILCLSAHLISNHIACLYLQISIDAYCLFIVSYR